MNDTGSNSTQKDTARISRILSSCRICPRECGVNRTAGQKGWCKMDGNIMVARAALHLWEEPPLSSAGRGSGAVFFSGCSLQCRFCQNGVIARGKAGIGITLDRLTDIFLELQDKGACNINLVTAEHFLPQAAAAIRRAKKEGLRIPVVYNSSGYEKADSLRRLEGLVDIYLPDFKYWTDETAVYCSHAPGYAAIAQKAIAEMVRQVPDPIIDEDGFMQKGVIVRHLLLPGHVKEAKAILDYLHGTYGDHIYISLLSQYTPMPETGDDPLLGRKVTKREYERLIDHAVSIGITKGFYQEGDTAEESFIPAFNGEGVLPEKHGESE